jgi:uncharacterized membrane protein
MAGKVAPTLLVGIFGLRLTAFDPPRVRIAFIHVRRARACCFCTRAFREEKIMRWSSVSLVVACLVACASVSRAAPMYNIVNIGTVQPGDSASQGFRISPNGIGTGRSVGSSTAQAFSWTQGGGIVGLPNLASPSRPFSVGNGVNNAGIVVGTGATTLFGSSPLPLMWQGGVVSQVPMPAGQTLGRANDINSSNVIIGSVNSGSNEVGFIASGPNSSVITALGPGGTFLRTAFGINDAGTVVGFVYNSVTNTATEVPPLPGANGALAFDVSEAGHIVGSSMLNQGSGLPFIWTSGGGTVAVPLAAGTSQGSARGVNSNGWVVGTDSSAFAIPFLYDGTQTYRLQDLIPAGTGWDLSTNTSSSALGISEDGIIVGTGVFNGQVRAYAMVPIPEPGALGALSASAALLLRRRRSV